MSTPNLPITSTCRAFSRLHNRAACADRLPSGLGSLAQRGQLFAPTHALSLVLVFFTAVNVAVCLALFVRERVRKRTEVNGRMNMHSGVKGSVCHHPRGAADLLVTVMAGSGKKRRQDEHTPKQGMTTRLLASRSSQPSSTRPTSPRCHPPPTAASAYFPLMSYGLVKTPPCIELHNSCSSAHKNLFAKACCTETFRVTHEHEGVSTQQGRQTVRQLQEGCRGKSDVLEAASAKQG
jgi:hypothetical protein